jgi:hypothetical protein
MDIFGTQPGVAPRELEGPASPDADAQHHVDIGRAQHSVNHLFK